eukprot:COSAG02_NODE_31112_length_539_cov_0.734091_2_plen_29_part_01
MNAMGVCNGRVLLAVVGHRGYHTSTSVAP